ncbi:MAG: hypothetical protein H0V01_02610 [Bacteroidetes bacterium]|nr:hypothetical protein [Bacteroidota bacterium]HET6243785.1 hypothetical protein [Bacteroidia bacterium]
MKKHLLLVMVAFAMMACNEQKVEITQEAPVYDWEDKSVFASSDLIDHYDKETDESRHVNPQLAEWLLTDAVTNENAEFFDAGSFDSDNINNKDNKPLTKEELSEILNRVRTVQVENPKKPGTYFQVTDTMTVEPRDIIQILTKEEWSMNKSTMSLNKKVTLMAPIIATYDEEGAERGKRILFWIKMK